MKKQKKLKQSLKMSKANKNSKQWNKQILDSAFTWWVGITGEGIYSYELTVREIDKEMVKEYSITKEEYDQLVRYMHTGIWVKN